MGLHSFSVLSFLDLLNRLTEAKYTIGFIACPTDLTGCCNVMEFVGFYDTFSWHFADSGFVFQFICLSGL